LWQKQVAKEIGCSKASLTNWEKGHAEPELRFLPAILRFLGYDPRPEPTTFGDRLKHAREGRGFSQAALAEALVVDEGTLRGWELGAHRPGRRGCAALGRLLGEF